MNIIRIIPILYLWNYTDFRLMIDKSIYNSIVADTPIIPKSTISMIADTMRIYCNLASFQPNEDIFNENIGISDTRSSDVATAATDRVIISASAGIAANRCDNGNNSKDTGMGFRIVAEESATIRADHKMACAGTGSPKKDVV